jgi:hypothetical protein
MASHNNVLENRRFHAGTLWRTTSFYEDGWPLDAASFGDQMPPIGRQPHGSSLAADGEVPAPQCQVSHLASLRAARAQHKAIARGIQVYFDAVTAERVPEAFLDVLEQQVQ